MRLKDFPHFQDFFQNKAEAKKKKDDSVLPRQCSSFSVSTHYHPFYKAHSSKHKQMPQKLCTQHSTKRSTSRAKQHHTPAAAQGSLLQHIAPGKLTGTLGTASSAHSTAPFPKGSPESTSGKEKHQENLLDFRNITRSKQTPSALAFTMNSWLH